MLLRGLLHKCPMAEHIMHPQNERFLIRCGVPCKMYSVRFHVYGQDVAEHGFFDLTGDGITDYGDLLLVSMLKSLPILKPGWCSESVVAFAEMQLMKCAHCGEFASTVCHSCSMICYCSDSCREADLSRHQSHCQDPQGPAPNTASWVDPPQRPVFHSSERPHCLSCLQPTETNWCFACNKVPWCPGPVAEERASEINSSVIDAVPRTGFPTAVSDVYLLEYSRSPKSFRDCLLCSLSLEPCRKALKLSGFDVELASGAKMFLHPWQVKSVLQALSSVDLKPRHVIAHADFESAIEHALKSLRSQERVKEKSRMALRPSDGSQGDSLLCNSSDVEDDDDDDDDNHAVCPYVIQRTFIHVPVPGSWSGIGGGRSTATI